MSEMIRVFGIFYKNMNKNAINPKDIAQKNA